MALLLSLLTALVLFSSGPGGALGCDPPQDHVLLSRENLVLLSQMSTISPLFCLKDRKHFRFPRATVDGSQVQKAQALSVLHEILQQISDLLTTENSSVTWNMTLVDQLRTGLHRQLEDLDTCWAWEMEEEGSALAMQGLTLALKRYFQGLRLYLKEKKYSDCAWEVVRVEIMRSFSSTRALQERLRNKDGDHPPLPMALLLSLLMALVLFSSGPGGALGCDLPEDHVLLSRENLVLLSQMSTISPFFCLKDRKHFRFPWATVDGSQVQKAQALSVLHEMLQQISDLLPTENSSVTWNMTLVDQLHAGLHQQLEDLDTCWAQEMGEEGSALAMQGPTLALKRYFQGLRLYLKEKKYSDCAWEVVRVEIMRSFSSTRALQERLRNKDGDL
ncbi:hypothetical protein QTO34_005585, partial [Cnephaeus nilssonii]